MNAKRETQSARKFDAQALEGLNLAWKPVATNTKPSPFYVLRGSIRSSPPMYGRRASGISTDPSACW